MSNEITLSLARFAWEIFVTLLAGAAFVVGWWGRRSSATKQAIDDTQAACRQRDKDRGAVTSDHERRLTILEQHVAHSPKIEHLESLRRELHELSEAVARQQGTMQSVERGLDRLHQYLLEHGK